jgi:protein ImuA
MEEALREPAVGAVVAEIGTVDLTASRRLQLAAEAGGAGAFLLRSQAGGAPTASVTRWRVTASGSGEVDEEVSRLAARSNGGVPPVGAARWRLELLRCRGGRPAAWTVEWCHATGDLALAAPLPDRPAVPAARGGGRPYALAV